MKYSSGLPYHLRVLLLVLLFLAGSLIFMDSMLSKTAFSPRSSTEACGGVKPVDQVVMLLIDAMRPDFALSSLSFRYSAGMSCDADSVKDAQKYPKRNATLLYLEEMLQNRSHPSHGFFLLADPPTVTCQRLKALMTGTVPAFLEAKANLNSDVIEIDNLLHQLHRRSILIGDETWLNLFPDDNEKNNTGSSSSTYASVWKNTITYPPYDVSDFYTNDNIVLDNILPALLSETVEKVPSDYAKLIIGHLLGVDHVGHRHHADHSEMNRVLSRIDSIIRNISHFMHHERNSTTRTLLLVLGDHGMTNSGDHGGCSFQETDTLLYAELFDGSSSTSSSSPSLAEKSLRRRSELTETRWNDELDEDLRPRKPCRAFAGVSPDKLSAAHQVDLTPTISALLDLPIPFNNLGRVIPELVLLADADADLEKLEECNWRQMITHFNESGFPMNPAWTEATTPWRRRIALMSHFGRKTRSEMSYGGMFLGSCLFMVCVFSTLHSSGMLQCIQQRNIMDIWSMVLLIFRVCVVFANSFVLKENVEMICLLEILLTSVLLTEKKKKEAFFLIGLQICIRVVVPLICRDRSHITHVAETVSPLEKWMEVNTPSIKWDAMGIFAGAFAFIILSSHNVERFCVVGLSTFLVAFQNDGIIHHVVPFIFFLLATFMHGGRNVRYMTFVLWTSSVCNERSLPCVAIAVYGAFLPSIVKSTRHLSSLTQAVLLHFVSWVAFFSQGNQCLFNAIDLNVFLIGNSSNNLILGGMNVMARTFNAFIVVPMAVMLVYKPYHQRGWHVCYLLVCLAVLQSSISSFNGYIQKSHLMLFPIFCPKFIFDLVACVFVVVGYLFALLFI